MKLLKFFVLILAVHWIFPQKLTIVAKDGGWKPPFSSKIPKVCQECPCVEDTIGCVVFLKIPNLPYQVDEFFLEQNEENKPIVRIRSDTYVIERIQAYYYKKHLYAISYTFIKPEQKDTGVYFSDQYHVFIDEEGRGEFVCRKDFPFGRTPLPPKRFFIETGAHIPTTFQGKIIEGHLQ